MPARIDTCPNLRGGPQRRRRTRRSSTMRTLDPRRRPDASRRQARTLVCSLLALAALLPASAEAIILTGGPVSIVDSTTPPTPAAPYPSQVNVPVGAAMVRDVNLRLDNLSHDFPSDVDVLLVGPDGTSVVLFSTPVRALPPPMSIRPWTIRRPARHPTRWCRGPSYLPTWSRGSPTCSRRRRRRARPGPRSRPSTRPTRSGAGASISSTTTPR